MEQLETLDVGEKMSLLQSSDMENGQFSSFEHGQPESIPDRGSVLLKDLARVLNAAAEAIDTNEHAEVFQETDFYEAVRKFEISLIRQALSRTGGNQAQAARMLHLKQTTLHGKIKQYKIYHTVNICHEDDQPKRSSHQAELDTPVA